MMDTFTNMDVEDRPLYTEVAGFDNLRATLDAKLAEYNDSNPVMDLVLFQQAWHS
jgi:dynein heavy chain